MPRPLALLLARAHAARVRFRLGSDTPAYARAAAEVLRLTRPSRPE